MPSLAKVTILWNFSVKIHRYMFSSVVVKMFQAVVCIECRAVHGTQYTEKFHKIVTLARLGIGSLRMVQMDRNM